MLFKCLFMLIILGHVLCDAVTPLGCVTKTFTIRSEDKIAYVSKSEKLVGYYPLEFKTEASSAASFCFTENNALMEVSTKFCIFGSDGDLTLVQNCNLQWMYDSNTKRLTTNGGRYLTPVVKKSGVVRLGLQSCCGDNSSMVFSEEINVPELCFAKNIVPYITCTIEVPYHPSVCDCGDRDICYILFTIKNTGVVKKRGENNSGGMYSINDGKIGPTIIIKHNVTLVVDVINEMDVPTSIHWHGMHQHNVPWMDGVGMITQWPIPPLCGKFRYILRTHPSGTNWYHSHVKLQRDEGIFGALVVKEEDDVVRTLSTELGCESIPVADNPNQMIAITEHLAKPHGPEDCSNTASNEKLYSFRMNGNKLKKEVDTANAEPLFITISPKPANRPGDYHRFRVIGAVEETVFRISIDDHKLFVVSTDGYLTEPFEVDVLHVHAGERYDFVLKPREIKDTDNNVFPIRIESVEVICEVHDRPSRSGIAYLKYSTPSVTQTKVENKKYGKDCIALNCPFGAYPKAHKDIKIKAPFCECHDVTALSLLVETSNDEHSLQNTTLGSTKFFNYDFYHTLDHTLSARVNDIHFTLPDTPFPVSGNDSVKDECPYRTTHGCRRCPHTVSVDKEDRSKPVEFVLSSLPRGQTQTPGNIVTKLGTHPIHLHGRSFWVKKIAYPKYSDEGKITVWNEDVSVPQCGFGDWCRKPPAIQPVNKKTIRKDTIIVPAGGYAVIEFVAYNPGSWLMHCHIDHHLEAGMGIVIRELPDCANPPPSQFMKQSAEVCISVDEFHEREGNQVCKLTKDAKAVEKLEGNNTNVVNDESAYRKLKKSLDYEEEQQHPRANLHGFQNGKPESG